MTSLQESFHLANSRYFRNRLKNVIVKWGRDMNPKHMGATLSQVYAAKGTRTFTIKIDPSLKKMKSVCIMTLLHEMVHVEQWDQVTDKTCHGRRFQRRMKQLAARGAFTGLW